MRTEMRKRSGCFCSRGDGPGGRRLGTVKPLFMTNRWTSCGDVFKFIVLQSILLRGALKMSQAEHGSGMKKTLTNWNFFTIGFGAIIGTGWVLLVGDWMVIGGGPVAAMIAFAIGAVFLLRAEIGRASCRERV